MDRNIAPIFGTVVYSHNGFSSRANLIDGRPENQAAAALGDYTLYQANADNDWVIIDLGEVRPLTGCALWGSADTYGRCVKDYRIALDNDVSGSFANVVIDSQISVETFYFSGQLIVQRDYQPITPQSARYVKLFLDTNYGHATSIETMELEIIGTELQRDISTINSASEIFWTSGSIDVLSDAYIVPAPIVTEKVNVISNAEITDERVDVLSDAFIAINVYSDACISAVEAETISSDMMVYRSGSTTRATFTMGKGSSTSFPATMPILIENTAYTSSSDEVVVADMITSSVMDMADVVPPLGYQNYGWKYDWVVRTYDNAQYKFEVRTGATVLGLRASTFSPITLGQIIPIDNVPRYHQWRCHVWASGSGDFELHQFSIKGYVDHPADLLYSSLNPGEFTTVSKVETGIDKPYEPMDMTKIWGGSYIPGDVNGDGVVDYDDILYLTTYMFTDGPAPIPVRRADVDDSGGVIDVADLVYLIDYVLTGGTPPRRFDASGLE